MSPEDNGQDIDRDVDVREGVKASESLNTLTSVGREGKVGGLKRRATFSGRRRVSIDLCEFGVNLSGVFRVSSDSLSLFLLYVLLCSMYSR
jgi:hypothetical protein